ncbi:hypothetical protein ASPZODRAFT_1961848 [Penicilliopsis zonata CBS 506.65]|uniref:Transcription factor domain-containing protein n=1 Tax=Penicilliopsis zonata CBS 506.65 TaxID=1073090 RepID=A0A1L9SH06_9EURO|nr:hypothetical protein ASPZODRAFT_1961848 [Penicilliopsis zonata CBS 506.65]OJJ46431.1 hypothetical protein ASPZODRAFT_1961848 [Penicilliopsis zonata CBS 506.65]
MDGIDLGPPMATLRSLGAVTKDDSATGFDPVSRGILQLDEAEKGVHRFFTYCHAWAPFISVQSCAELRQTPVLFLGICTVGMRFEGNNSLTSLLDQAVSRLLLRPSLTDVTLDSIRVLLLYAQWMPYTAEGNRYNEISAWAVLGLAVRYAQFLGLEASALSPFQACSSSNPAAITGDHLARIRVWYNLLTCDFNLMLTSGLPASLDPEASAQVARRFGGHRAAQQPADLRVAGLVELVALVHRAMRRGGDASGRKMNAEGLHALNVLLDEWEGY